MRRSSGAWSTARWHSSALTRALARSSWPPDGDHAEPAQVDGDRRARQRAGAPHQLLGRGEQLGVVVGERAARLQPDWASKHHRPAADAGAEEVAVAWAPLPQPRRPAGESEQAFRLRQEELGRLTLHRRHLVQAGANGVEVSAVAAPARRLLRSSTWRSQSPATAEASTVPAASATARNERRPGRSSRRPTEPAPPASGRRWDSQPAPGVTGYAGGAATTTWSAGGDRG
jgi:hypothetical protein